MSKEMVISANPHETRVAIMEEGQLCEYYVERQKEFALVGSIYKGNVTRVLPGMQSAFVEIGLDSDAFLYVRTSWKKPRNSTTSSPRSWTRSRRWKSRAGTCSRRRIPPRPRWNPPTWSGRLVCFQLRDRTRNPWQVKASMPAERAAFCGRLLRAPLAPPVRNAPPQDRPRFEGRNRGGNRDFGRRGGGGGGRGGRFNRRAGGGGGRQSLRRRTGPAASKYASPGSHEEQPVRRAPPEGHVLHHFAGRIAREVPRESPPDFGRVCRRSRRTGR